MLRFLGPQIDQIIANHHPPSRPTAPTVVVSFHNLYRPIAPSDRRRADRPRRPTAAEPTHRADRDRLVSTSISKSVEVVKTGPSNFCSCSCGGCE